MDEKEFFQKIFNYEREAKELKVGCDQYNIKRGIAHSISGFIEDLFAVYVANRIQRKDYEYWVDKAFFLRLEGATKAKAFKPDLAIITPSKEMTHYFDTKTNLGWNRDLQSYLKEKSDFVKSIRGQKTQGDHPIQIAPDLKYQMVVIYGWNINQQQLEKNRKLAAEYADCVDFYVLYIHVGPKKDDNVINQGEFDRLHETIDKLRNA